MMMKLKKFSSILFLSFILSFTTNIEVAVEGRGILRKNENRSKSTKKNLDKTTTITVIDKQDNTSNEKETLLVSFISNIFDPKKKSDTDDCNGSSGEEEEEGKQQQKQQKHSADTPFGTPCSNDSDCPEEAPYCSGGDGKCYLFLRQPCEHSYQCPPFYQINNANGQYVIVQCCAVTRTVNGQFESFNPPQCATPSVSDAQYGCASLDSTKEKKKSFHDVTSVV